ncbi:MAG: hypothetical protein AAF772_04210, partial [Acidobacteriota bacterium]
DDDAARAAADRGGWTVIARAALARDRAHDGPLIVVDDHASLVVEAGWRVRRAASDALVATRVTDPPGAA